MKKKTHAVVFALLVAAPSVLAGADTSSWPGYLGPARNARAQSPGAELAGADGVRFETLWRRPLGSGYSGISVSRGRAFTLYSNGESDLLAAIDTTSGETLWEFPLAPTFPGYSGAADGPTSTPTVSGDLVFAVGPRGQLVAAATDSGRVLWQQDLVGELGGTVPTWGVTSSPLVVGDRVIVLVGGKKHGTVCAFGRSDGSTLWCAGETSTGYQSPTLLVVGGTEQLAVTSNTHLYGIDPENGEVQWSFPYEPKGGEGSSQPIMVGGDRLLIEAESGFSLLRVQPATRGLIFKRLWETRNIRNSFALPLVHNGAIFGYRDSIFACLDAESGEIEWQSRAPGEGEAILIDDRIVSWGGDGRLRLIEATADDYREIASYQALRRGSFTTPAYAGGVLFVRNLQEIAAVRIAPIAAGTAAAK